MKKYFKRLLASIGRMLARLFNVGIPLKVVLILVLLVGGLAVGLTYSGMMKKVGGKDDYAEAMRYIEIKDAVADNYIDAADREKMGQSAAAAMVSGLGDKWSYYMTPDEYKSYKLSSANEYSGIGMSIAKEENGSFRVVSVNAGSAAAEAGVSAGMIITDVDGESLRGMSEDEVRTLIRSKLNSKFQLEINNQYNLDVDCTNFNSNAVLSRLEKTGAVYVQVKNFEAGSGQAAVDAIEYFMAQGADSCVLDLRNNAGGLSEEVRILLDYLLPEGRLFSEVSKDGSAEVSNSDGMWIQFPMVVLINGGTFRESELCAAVLKEYRRATLMGESTSGSTRSQETIPLADGSAIRLSTRSYLTPNGTDISKVGGVVPDMIVFNSDESATGTTEGTTGGDSGTASISADEQLMTALKYLS